MGAMPGTAESQAASTADRQWLVIGRWQEYAGEARANLLRIAGIGSFYVIELINYHGLHLGPLELPATVDLAFHEKATALAAAWTLMALATLVCLRLRIFPDWLKYVTTFGDVVLLSLMLMMADGPRSPLVVGYFLVIVLATLRFQLRLIWCATVASMIGYLWVASLAVYRADSNLVPDLSVPRYYQLIMLLALALTGIVLGQVIRRVRAMAEDLSRRLQRAARGAGR